MTDEQAAKVPSLRTQLLTAAHEFSVYLPEPLEPGDCDELMHILEPVVTSLLAARERAVWLEAAKVAEIYADCMEEDLPHNERIQRLTQQVTAQTIAKRCRQQAEEVKP